jgi:hypothetical protein
VFQFRDDGAAWGLVALDQQVNRSPLLTGVDAAIGRARTPFEVAAPAPAVPSPAPAAPPTAGPAAATSSTASPGQPVKSPSSSTPSGPTPSNTPTLPTSPSPVAITPPVQPGVLDNTVSGLLDTLNGLLAPKR